MPQIVVIGSQSSGKSSVLENLVGKDFLPRGSGIVTRRPLILQLNHIDEEREWGEFKHKPRTKIERFDAIKQEIQNETDRAAGRNCGITDDPILLRIFSNKVVNLTLVDLPGIARIPIGDQPSNIEQLITDMVKRYIEKPNSIILAVHAANQDLATSDAIKLANEVDPNRVRTIGVLTKVDLMDKGTDAMSILEGKEMNFMNGWVPIVSRSQEDIRQNKPIEESLLSEQVFFKSHPLYNQLGDRVGTQYLADKCNRLLTDHIKKTIPILKKDISSKIKVRKNELKSYGEPVQKDTSARETQLIHLLNRFYTEFRRSVEGSNVDIDSKVLSGGARIRYILNESFPTSLDSIQPLEGLSLQDVRIVLRNASGTRSALLVPDKAFEQLAKRQIENLRDPSSRTSEMVYYELNRILVEMDTPDLRRFPKFKEKVVEIACKVAKKCLKNTNSRLEDFINLEIAYINTNHPDFEQISSINDGKKNSDIYTPEFSDKRDKNVISGFFSSILWGAKSRQVERTTNQNTDSDSLNIDDLHMSPREKNQVKTLSALISSYMKIEKKTTLDQVTKIIMATLVNGTLDILLDELITQLSKRELIDELLYESQDIEVNRQRCRDDLEKLSAAKAVLMETEMYETHY